MSVDVTLPSDREIRVVRQFKAPRQLVWDCHTKPELFRRWCLGPPGWSMPVCRIDLRVGGRYRYIWQSDETGERFGSAGEHLEIETLKRLVTTEIMDGLDGQPMQDEPDIDRENAAVNTLVLAETEAGTTLTITMAFPSQDIRDGALASGMADGMSQGYDRLEAIAAEMAA